MRVCHVVPTFFPFLPDPYEYTRGLTRRGYEVDVVAMKRSEESYKDDINGVRVTRVDVSHVRVASLRALRFLKTAADTMKGNDYDLVHVYGFRGSGLLPIISKNAADLWVFDLRTGNVSGRRAIARIADLVTRMESKSYSARIALDKHVAYKVFGKRADFFTVPLGADISKFSSTKRMEIRRHFAWKHDAKIAIYTGSLLPNRQPEVLLQSFALAAERCSQLELLVISRNIRRQRVIELIQNSTNHADIVKRVHVLEYIPYNEIQDYIAAADIGFAYVPATDRFYYQPPLKTVEFLAAGLPTLATDTHGNRCFVEDGVNGIITPDNSTDIGSALLRMATDDELRRRLSLNARQSVERFDWSRIVDEQLIPVYETLMSSSTRQQP